MLDALMAGMEGRPGGERVEAPTRHSSIWTFPPASTLSSSPRNGETFAVFWLHNNWIMRTPLRLLPLWACSCLVASLWATSPVSPAGAAGTAAAAAALRPIWEVQLQNFDRP